MEMKQIAAAVQAQGRGPDKMLVHMTPGEVAGLQALAEAHGGSLTINPQTGLPEANFLESILPAIVGIGLTVASGGALSPLMAAALVGGGTALITGNTQQGLMAGLGAYGGAGLGAGLVAPAATTATGIGAGAVAGGTTAATTGAAAPALSGAASPALTEAMKQAALQEGLKASVADQMAQQATQQAIQDAALQEGIMLGTEPVAGLEALSSAAQTPVIPGAQTVPQVVTPTAPAAVPSNSWGANLQQGVQNAKNLFTDPAARDAYMKASGGFKGVLGKVGMATAPYWMAMGEEEDEDPDGYKRPSIKDMDMRQPTLADVRGGGGGGGGGRMPRYRYDRGSTTFQRLAAGGYVPAPNAKAVPYRGRVDDLGLVALADQMQTWTPPVSAAPTTPVHTPPVVNSSGGGGGGGEDITEYEQYEYGAGMGDSGEGIGGIGGDGTGGVGGSDGGMFAEGGLASESFIIPADVVSALGNGSTDAGLRALQQQWGDVRPIKGKGDGLSDSISTHIEGRKKARVADGEAYVPPRTVAAIGGGDQKRGAKKLYATLEKVRAHAHGKTQQQSPVNPRKALA